MSSGKANFNYIRYKANFSLNQELSIDLISKKEKIDTEFDQYLCRSENLSQNGKFDRNQPLDNTLFDLFQKILDIHAFLLFNYTELSTDSKLEYCNLERYFMKKYLKEIIKKSTFK